MARQLQHDEGQAKKETPTMEVVRVIEKLPADIEEKLAKLEKLEALLKG